jgi:hypothetical protein
MGTTVKSRDIFVALLHHSKAGHNEAANISDAIGMGWNHWCFPPARSEQTTSGTSDLTLA